MTIKLTDAEVKEAIQLYLRHFCSVDVPLEAIRFQSFEGEGEFFDYHAIVEYSVT